MAFVPSFTDPVEMYVTPALESVLGVGYKAAAINAPPFAYNGALYRILQTAGVSPSPGQIWMMQSLNGGQTWSILDLAGSPIVAAPPNNFATGGYIFDGAHTLILAYQNTGGTVDGAIQLQNFDLATGLWGAAYGAATAPLCRLVNQLFLRSDGSLLCVFNRTFSGGSIVGLAAASFSAGVWNARFNIDVNLGVGLTSNTAEAGVYDPLTGTVHVFGGAFDAGFVNFYPFYQQVLLNDTLGSFTQFAAGAWESSSNLNNPVIVGQSIIWGVNGPGGNYATAVIGTPLAAPVFSVIPFPGVDLGVPPFPSSQYVPALWFDGSRIWGVYCYVGASNALRLVQTQNLADPALGWSGATIYDDATGPVLLRFEEFPTITVLPGFGVLVTVGAIDNLGAGGMTEFFLSGSIPNLIDVQIVLRGVKRSRWDSTHEPLKELSITPKPSWWE